MSNQQRPTWQAHPGAQTEFVETNAYEVLFGGSKGGGKSECLLMGALRFISSPYHRALIVRRTFKELEQLWDRSTVWYKANGGIPNKSEHRWTFPSGAVIEFGYCENLTDAQRYSGREYNYLGIDEITHIDENSYKELLSCCRSSSGLPIHIRLTCNPAGPDHWVFKRFQAWLDPREEYQGPRQVTGKALFYVLTDDGVQWCRKGPNTLSRMFIRASANDNPSLTLNDPTYMQRLADMDPVRRAQLRDGDWLVKPAAGTYFKRIWFKSPSILDSNIVNRVRAWDLGSTTTGDWTIGVLMGKTATGGYVVEDVVRIRARPAERDALILRTAGQDGHSVKQVLPQDPAAAGVSQRDAHAKLLAGFNVRFVRPTGSKVTRSLPFSAQVEAGNVACAAGAWREPFLSCLEGFPDDKHDDDVDAASDAFNALVHDPITYFSESWKAPTWTMADTSGEKSWEDWDD